MQHGQPPSWRPDVDQFRAETYRGTVRDALGGLRNLEQLLGSLRVGPRALLSVLPDVRSNCPALAEAIDGLAALVVSKLADAEGIAVGVRQVTHARLGALANAIESVERQTLSAKNRLRIEEAVSGAAGDIEATVELIDMLGEVAWGRTMPLDLLEVAREAYRSSEPSGSHQPAIRLTLVSDNACGDHVASPHALVRILHHLVRWFAGYVPNVDPVVSVVMGETHQVEVHVQQAATTGEVRWAPGGRLLPVSEDALRVATSAMHLDLELVATSGRVRLVFPRTSTTLA
jgi:hypothetical protein